MALYRNPRSYEEAAARIGEKIAAGKGPNGGTETIEVRQTAPAAISMIHDGEAFVVFYADGRIKLRTLGTNSFAKIARINSCLPPPYRIYKAHSKPHCGLTASRRTDAPPILTFLSSATFTPDLAREGACSS